MADDSPHVVIIAGPNGAGKSTMAPQLLNRVLRVTQFVNADVIAHGLSGFEPERAAVAAGRIMLTQLHQLAAARQCFAFETTLASRTFAQWIGELVQVGYRFHLYYLWVPSPELSVSRVADRVRQGGHSVPTDVIRRRFHRSRSNFFEFYQKLATRWRVYNNAEGSRPTLLALGRGAAKLRVVRPELWSRFADE